MQVHVGTILRWWGLKFLTLTMLELKVTNLCSHFRARPAWTSMQSNQSLYCWLSSSNTHFVKLISAKLIMDSPTNQMWTSPFKKFSSLRVDSVHIPELCEKYTCIVLTEIHHVTDNLYNKIIRLPYVLVWCL